MLAFLEYGFNFGVSEILDMITLLQQHMVKKRAIASEDMTGNTLRSRFVDTSPAP